MCIPVKSGTTKIIIVGDSHARNIFKLLSGNVGDNFEVVLFVQPGVPMIKHLPTSEKLILLKIYNRIFKKQCFPNVLLDATVIPFLKTVKKTSKLPPISLTSMLFKLVEKMVN